jgi:hypothetical protein
MTPCDYCGTGILFNAIKQGELRFCSTKCAAKAEWVRASLAVPDAEVERQVRETHSGPCPRCGGPGPVDVHTSHRVYSALAWTSWSSHPDICCRSCGCKKYLKHGAFSFFLGWWGFPHGLIITPVQVARNLAGVLGIGEPAPDTPSPSLSRMIRLSLAAKRRVHSDTAGSSAGSPAKAKGSSA